MAPSGKLPDKVSRRGFLIAITGSAIAAAAGCRPSGVVAPTAYAPGSAALPTGTSAPAATATMAATQSATSAATAEVADAVDPTYGKVTYDKLIITPTDKLYVTQYDYDKNPEIKAEYWKLTVDGLVEKSLQLSYNDVLAFPPYEDTRTLECIGNPVGGDQIGNIQWKGFLFQEILDKVKVKSTATHVKFECADGYATSVKLEWLTQPKVMLAYEMNGKPLNNLHGFPIRILTPGLYGQKMPRWITHIEFIDFDFLGYWETHGWSNIASVQTNSIIQSPDSNATLKAGTNFVLQGVAWAGKRAITKVEIQVDSGDWMPAELTKGPSPLSWTQWYVTYKLPAPGSYHVAVRATDDTGFTQTQEAQGIFGNSAPDGTNEIHRINLQVS